MMNLKLIFCFIVICSVVWAQAPRRDDQWPPKSIIDMLQPVRDICISKSGATPDAIKRFSDEEIHEDEALKCYMNCLFHELNLVNDNGEAHLEKIFDLIPKEHEDILLNMGKRCLYPPKDKSLCEQAFWLHSCWKKADPVHYFLI